MKETPPRTSAGRSNQLRRDRAGSGSGLWSPLLLLAGIAAGVLSYWAWLLSRSHIVESTEVQVLANVLWWKRGMTPWGEPGSLPLQQNSYGPLYTWLCTALPDVRELPYLTGRLLSVGAMVGVALIVFLWGRRRRGSLPAALVAALILFTVKPVLSFAPLYRVDALGLLLSVAGFALATTGRSRPALAGSAVLFGLAVATKVAFVAAPLAAIVHHWRADRRRGVLFAMAIGVAAAASVLASQAVAQGGYVDNVRWATTNWAPLRAVERLLRLSLSVFWILALVSLGRRRRRVLEASPALAYVLISFVVTGALCLVREASWNSFLELYVALALLTGDLLGSHEPRAEGERSAQRLILVHAVLSILLIGLWITDDLRAQRRYREVYEQAVAELAPAVSGGERLAVVGTLAGRDALNALGAPNWANVALFAARSPSVLGLLEEADREGRVEVRWGDDLSHDPPEEASALAGAPVSPDG